MKQSKSKKSTTKNRSFKVSPLIPIIAVIEVLVLVVIGSYAWYFFRASKVIGSGTISVAADSGLDIDFQYSNVDDYINIWNYVDQDFKFEPASSLDGRNIYFPTSGTFEKDKTKEIVFRDGTVNDINSKYLSIDFELTNTSGSDQYVYLNNNSYFQVKKDNVRQESRALRLAFYQNDGNSGNVGSSLLRSNSSSDGGISGTDSQSASSTAFTLYFDNDTANWGAVYAYYWDTLDSTNHEYLVSWPGTKMQCVSGKVYALTIDNPLVYEKTKDNQVNSNKQYYTRVEEDGVVSYNSVSSPVAGSLNTYYEYKLKYDRVIFNNNYNEQTSQISLTSDNNGYLYKKDATGSLYQENTVYFLKPSNWNSDSNSDGVADVYCYAWTTQGNAHSLTNWPGDLMTYVGSGIYSYTYNSASTGGFLFNNGYEYDDNQTGDITVDADPSNPSFSIRKNTGTTVTYNDTVNGTVFYCDNERDSNNKYVAKPYTVEGSVKKYDDLKYNTLYLFNTYGWENPYATVSVSALNSVSTTDTEIAMVALSGNMYYCTVPEFFTHVSFHQKGKTAANYRTAKQEVADQRVYRPKDEMNGNIGHQCDTFLYSKYIKAEGYPVISPGVSAGFQRPYSPVITIDADSGYAEDVVPAYSNSIDNYILGSGTELFVLKANHMASLSMIMWLEGTDDAASGDLYPANTIDFKLEFSTLYYTNNQGATEEHIVNPGDSDSYTYKFYDRTREIWTSNRQPTESGVTVAPVMQLYDNTIKRGYLMKPVAYGSYNGERKVSCWAVDAPQSIAKYGHDIIFRRVNPYDEDEVWNYWHAGPVAGTRTKTNGVFNTYTSAQPIYSIATAGATNTISFTAFADGSPLPTMSGLSGDTGGEKAGNITNATYKVPDESCGGLWGNHNIRNVTVFDGLRGQPLQENKGVLTLNYKYTYTDGTNSIPVKIEYKGSTSGFNCFYYFIVPDVAFANPTPCCFKRYRNFESGYAINSAEKNPDITFVDYYGEDQEIAGDYFELNEQTDGVDLSYWGSDMLYIQKNADTQNVVYTSSSSSDNNAKLFQVHFNKSNSFGETSNDTFRFAYLYPNSYFNSQTGDGYACVVPNDDEYNYFRLENCSYTGSKYNVSAPQTISRATTVTITDPLNSSISRSMLVNYLDNNLITTTYIGIRIWIQTTHQSIGNDPRCYVYNDNDERPSEWPGYLMWYQEDIGNMKKYFVCDGDHNIIDVNVSKYNKLQFAYYGGSSKSQVLTLNLNTVRNDLVYQSNGGNGNVGLVYSGDNVTLKVSYAYTDSRSSSWPQLTFNSNS